MQLYQAAGVYIFLPFEPSLPGKYVAGQTDKCSYLHRLNQKGMKTTGREEKNVHNDYENKPRDKVPPPLCSERNWHPCRIPGSTGRDRHSPGRQGAAARRPGRGGSDG